MLPYLEAVMNPPITGSRTAKRFISVGDVEESWSGLLCAVREKLQRGHQPCFVWSVFFLYEAFFLNYSKEMNLRDCE